MARQDDYVNAYKLAAAELKSKDPQEVSRLTQVEYDQAQGLFIFDFIGRKVTVSHPDAVIGYVDSDQDVPLTEQVLILHYLNKANEAELSGELITYREIPSGEFYFPAFRKRAEIPMLSVFGPDPHLLEKTAPKIGGQPAKGFGDAAASFRPLPKVPLTLVIWGGDEEFEPSGKILFDKSIAHFLSTEDVAWISGMIVYRLMRLANS